MTATTTISLHAAASVHSRAGATKPSPALPRRSPIIPPVSSMLTSGKVESRGAEMELRVADIVQTILIRLQANITIRINSQPSLQRAMLVSP